MTLAHHPNAADDAHLSFVCGHVQRQQVQQRRWPCWLFIALTGLLPNLSVLMRRGTSLATTGSPAQAVWTVVGEALLMLGLAGVLLGLAGLCGRSATRLLGLLLIPVGAVAAWFMALHQVVIGHGAVLAVLSADHDLSRELLDAPLLAWLLLAGLLPALVWWRIAPPSWWRGPRRRVTLLRWLAWLMLSALVMTGSARLLSSRLAGVSGAPEPTGAPHAASAAGIAAHAYVPSNWLAGVGVVAGQAWRQHRDGRALRDPGLLHQYGPQVALDDLVVVLVIGETTRHDRMGLLGHGRDTTPAMALERDLAAFAGRSCDTSTQLSLACMFVRPHAVQRDPAGGPDAAATITERDVFAVYRRLGFRIELYAMQGEAGFYGRVGADEMKLREMVLAEPAYQGRPAHDDLLVDELRGALDRHDARASHQPLLVVLHTKGSHDHYAQRYPADQAIWRPDCSAPDEVCDDAALLNAYDNSVRHVDAVLQAVRDSVRPRRAWVVYSADHGESIGDGRHFHATPRSVAPPEQFKVPLVFWASPGFLADPLLAAGHRRLTDRARRDPPDRHGHHELYASMLGCIGVRSPDGGIDPALDLCAGP